MLDQSIGLIGCRTLTDSCIGILVVRWYNKLDPVPENRPPLAPRPSVGRRTSPEDKSVFLVVHSDEVLYLRFIVRGLYHATVFITCLSGLKRHGRVKLSLLPRRR